MASAESRQHDDTPVTLVWIDARTATIASWDRGDVGLVRVSGDVPPHERSVGHVHLDPTVRHGGGQRQDKLDHRRLEHEHAFLDEVGTRIPGAGRVEVIGPGTVRLHLLRRLRAAARDGRAITTEPAGLLSEPQLLARLRELAGRPAPRQLAHAR